MFHLERLEISGFKSFNESAQLTFPGAITAVIGPNGCGKSNICDAVAWALGEQSARVLRGEKMDDVIFNGSGKRRPLGMAEVTLTLKSRNGDFPETDGRVAIGRRVYRDGEGEYFLNGKRVRLKDVQDVIFGTGLGVRAYSIIEQGKIDQVLSSKPQDRRKLIEEAAGITKYKARKRAAELKLEETRANLTRLSDIVSEVDRACASLKRQASKAERYKERTELLREKRLLLARLTFDALSEESRQASAALAERRDEEAAAAADLAACEAAEAESRRLAIDARARREQAREELAAITSAVERDDAAIEAARRAEIEIAARREAVARDSDQLARESAARSETRRRLEEERGARRAEFDSAEIGKRTASQRRRVAEERMAAIEGGLDAARQELAGATAERAQARNARHEIDLALERTAAARSRLGEAAGRLEAAVAALDGELAAAESDERERAESARAAAAAFEETEARLRETAARVASLEEERGRAREEIAVLEQRAEALEHAREDRERRADRVAQALDRRGIASRGLLAARLVARPGWEGVIDRLASAELAAVLVAGAPEEAARRLREEGVGGAVVGEEWPAPAGSSEWQRVLENFADLSPALRSALPAAVFVETAEEAADGARRNPGLLHAARSGEIARGALLRVPSPRPEQAGLLSLHREIEEARRARADREASLACCEENLARERERRAALEGEVATLADVRRAAESSLAAHSARLAERRDDRARKLQEIETLRAEDEILASEAAGLSARRAETTERERALEVAEAEIRSRIEAAAAELAAARPEIASSLESEAAARESLEGARERLASVERESLALAAHEEVAQRRRNEWDRESEALAARQETARREAEQARTRRDVNVLAREASARTAEAASIESDRLSVAAADAEDAVRRVRAIFDDARQKRFDAEILFSRVSSDLQHAVESTGREFGVSPEALPPDPGVDAEARGALETEAAELADQIEKMGPVNVLAFEEYREQSERLTFLTTQKADLETSIASLMDTIRKINATSSERFAEAFAAINTHFAELFQRLFRGGSAQMRLLDENDLLDSGIEITAQPPGKRNQSILLLSGGEKAMTAIALLMGIFKYKPSPFCILDEVDAPLDDANIDRFAQLIREMSEETQFIAMTHNKRTMESADALYGVTMEEPGCSKIVSVKFD